MAVIALVLLFPIVTVFGVRLPLFAFVGAFSLLRGLRAGWTTIGTRELIGWASILMVTAFSTYSLISLGRSTVPALLPLATALVVRAAAQAIAVDSRRLRAFQRGAALAVVIQLVYIAVHWVPMFQDALANVDLSISQSLYGDAPIGYFPLFRPGGTYISATYLAVTLVIVGFASLISGGGRAIYYVSLSFCALVVAKGAMLVWAASLGFSRLLRPKAPQTQLAGSSRRRLAVSSVIALVGAVGGVAVFADYLQASERFYATEVLFSGGISGMAHGVTHRTEVLQVVFREMLESPLTPGSREAVRVFEYFDNGVFLRISQTGLLPYLFFLALFYWLLPLSTIRAKLIVAVLFFLADLGLVYTWAPLSWGPMAFLILSLKQWEAGDGPAVRAARPQR